MTCGREHYARRRLSGDDHDVLFRGTYRRYESPTDIKEQK